MKKKMYIQPSVEEKLFQSGMVMQASSPNGLPIETTPIDDGMGGDWSDTWDFLLQQPRREGGVVCSP